MKSDPARKSQSRTTGSGLKPPGRNGKAEKNDTKKNVAQKATPLDNPQTLTPDQTPAPEALTPAPGDAKKSGSSVLVWLALPVLAIAAVGAYIAWDQYTEQHKTEVKLTEQLDDVKPVVPPPTGPERSREVKTEPDPVPAAFEPEDLPGIAKDPKKPKPVPKVVVDPKVSMIRSLKDEIDQVNNPAQNGRFRLELRALEDLASKGGEVATFQAKVNELKSRVKDALAKQNQ